MRRLLLRGTVVVALAVGWAGAALAGQATAPDLYARADSAFATAAAPDIVGHGQVTSVNDFWVKVSNIGVVGNPFTSLSDDPSGQWPGPSGVEYLFFVGTWVGAKDPASPNPLTQRRVSQNTEWRPPTLDPVDRIYATAASAPGGAQMIDDDGDGRIDEDRLDGRDNDGDGLVDEDYAAVGSQAFSLVVRDDTPESQVASSDPHLPLGIELHRTALAFGVVGEQNYVAFEDVYRNVSGRELDSLFVAFQVDQDVGPRSRGNYFADDLPEPRFPQGPDPSVGLPADAQTDPFHPNLPYVEFVDPSNPKYQAQTPVGDGSLPGACTRDVIRVHGFSMVDDDGDDGLTPGASMFLLLDHPVDVRDGRRAPRQVGFHMYQYFKPGVPFAQGGPPTNDLERYELISSRRGVNPGTGLIDALPPTTAADYFHVASVGPFRSLAPGDSVRVVWALAVDEIDRSATQLRRRYDRLIQTATRVQRNYNGTFVRLPGFAVPDSADFGRETKRIAPEGQVLEDSDCRDGPFSTRGVTSAGYTWFDYDCNTCTGVPLHVRRPWAVREAPPADPELELRSGDRRVTLRWDNRSLYSPDPATGEFDFKGFVVWRAAGWTRPPGSPGPADEFWQRLATYYWHDELNPLIERVVDPGTGLSTTIRTSGVLVNRVWQPGSPYPRLIHAADLPCLTASGGACDTVFAIRRGRRVNGGDSTVVRFPVVRYPVGRFELVDPQVLNGFVYFYAVTAFDSTGAGALTRSLSGRRGAFESQGVTPQKAVAAGDGRVYVVPNPFRRRADWDLNPNPVDPTGTHIDFFNMPAGPWTLRIYTLAGDLVQEIRSSDARVDGRLQQEGPDDGQATWNLVSRNGQEVASGIYLFSVQSASGTQQGRFVIIR